MNHERKAAQANLLPHYTKGGAWHDADFPIIDAGQGCYVSDTEGNQYLDGLAGLFCTNIGHGRQDLAAAAMKQMERLAFFPNWGFASPPTIEAAQMIAEFAPNDLNEVFFVSSGSEAVESAVKFARNYHVARGEDSRYKVIARNWAYHGTTLGALSVTGIPKFRTQFLPLLWDGVRHVANTCDGAGEAGTPVAEWPCVKELEQTILDEGPETVALIIAEPVQNGRGAVVPPEGYWQELRRICDQYGILLCADEVINAFGRLGHWFASERFDIDPDMITFAKGVTSAYQPLGGVVIRERLVHETWDSELGMYNHGSTFGGHPVACAVAVANMKAMRDEKVLENVLAHEQYFQDKLARRTHRQVRRHQGMARLWLLLRRRIHGKPRGRHRTQRRGPRRPAGGVLGGFVKDSKLLIRPDDRGATMLVLSPPLIADEVVLDDIFDRMDQILTNVEAWMATQRSHG